MVELVGNTVALQRMGQTVSVKSEQAAANSTQTAHSDTGIVLRYPTDQVEISEAGLAQAAQQNAGAAMRGERSKPAGAAAGPASTGAQSAQAAQTTEMTHSAESKELESAKRTLAQLETADETEKTVTKEAGTQSTSNLASLTEQQIETLVKEGSITRAEADNELASRVEPEM